MAEQSDDHDLERRLERNEMRRDIREMQKSIKCLHDGFDEFAGRYRPYLEKIMENHLYWNRVREDVIKGTARSIVWAIICGFCIAVFFAAKDYLAHLVTHAMQGPPPPPTVPPKL